MEKRARSHGFKEIIKPEAQLEAQSQPSESLGAQRTRRLAESLKLQENRPSPRGAGGHGPLP